MSDNLRDLIASALRGDGEWDSLSEKQKVPWRADADRALGALRSVPTTNFIDDLAQEIRRVDGSNSLGAAALAEALVPFLCAIAALPAPAGVEVTEEELARFINDYTGNDENGDKCARKMRSRFTILTKPAQEGGL